MRCHDSRRPTRRRACKSIAPDLQGAGRPVCKTGPKSPDVGHPPNTPRTQISNLISTSRIARLSQSHRPLSGLFVARPDLQDCKPLRTPRLQDGAGAVLAGGGGA